MWIQRPSIVYFLVSAFVAVASLMVGPRLLEMVDVDPAEAFQWSVVVSFVSAFIGIGCSILAQIDHIDRKIEQNSQNTVIYRNGKHALQMITGELGRIRKVCNLRIVPDGATYNASEWNKSIIGYVVKGCEFTDAVFGQGETSANDIAGKLNQKKKREGIYKAYQIDCTFPSFLNFKIVTYDDDRREVWVGWRISATSGSLAEPCFVSEDQYIIEIFQKWFDELLEEKNLVCHCPKS